MSVDATTRPHTDALAHPEPGRTPDGSGPFRTHLTAARAVVNRVLDLAPLDLDTRQSINDAADQAAAEVIHAYGTAVAYAATPEVDPASYRAGYAAGQADAFTGAADAPGDLDAVPTEGQWLRRLLDLPAPQRLAAASYFLDASRASRVCFEANHQDRLAAAGLQLAAARGAVEDAARVTEEARAQGRADRLTAAARAWDAAADYLTGAQGPDVSRILRGANPYVDHPAAAPAAPVTVIHAWGSDDVIATLTDDDLGWTEHLHDAVGVDDQGSDL